MGSIGIVGLGKQAEKYINVIKQIPGWDITAVCDRDKDISLKVSSLLNAGGYTSVEELAASKKCDVYFIFLPHGVIANMPLFRKTEQIMPRLYDKPAAKFNAEYTGAENFFTSAFKIPVWAREQDRDVMISYASGIKKVAEAVLQRPEIFTGIK